MTDPAALAALQKDYADAVDERRRLDEIKPPDLPGMDGGDSTAMETWLARREAVDTKVAELRDRLDAMTHEGAGE